MDFDSLWIQGNITNENLVSFVPINGGSTGDGNRVLSGNDMPDMGVTLGKVIVGRPKQDHPESATDHMGLS